MLVRRLVRLTGLLFMPLRESGRRYSHRPPQRPAHRPARASSYGLKIAALGTIGALALWSGATALYLYFHDDALNYLMARQTEIVRSYDARRVAFESEVARLKSLKLIDQERVDRVVSELSQRQAEIEDREKKLAELAAKSKRRSEPPAESRPVLSAPRGRDPDFGIMPKPSPISDDMKLRPRFEHSSELRSSSLRRVRSFVVADASQPIQTRIDNLYRGLSRIEARQAKTLAQLEKNYDGRETRMRTVLAELNIAVPAPASPLAVGGPFVPLQPGEYAFDQRLTRVEEAATAVTNLDRVLDFVPVRYPVPRDADITSGFGVRADPFFHASALHSGIDFRGEPGERVRATAAGVVTGASYRGGYGLMVEIDHGNGLVTRYGHLSAIDAVEGQHVEPGDIVGRIGTTGRSTGPHLHYEVRVKGEAIDPQRYLRAGLPLQAG